MSWRLGGVILASGHVTRSWRPSTATPVPHTAWDNILGKHRDGRGDSGRRPPAIGGTYTGGDNVSAVHPLTAPPMPSPAAFTPPFDNPAGDARASTSVRVSWGSSGPAVTYRLERQISTPFVSWHLVVEQDTLAYQDTTVDLGLTYQYRVRAERGAIVSDWVTSPAITIPSVLASRPNRITP